MTRRLKNVIGCAVLAVSCAPLQRALRLEEPAIRLQEVRITGIGLTGGTLDLA